MHIGNQNINDSKQLKLQLLKLNCLPGCRLAILDHAVKGDNDTLSLAQIRENFMVQV